MCIHCARGCISDSIEWAGARIHLHYMNFSVISPNFFFYMLNPVDISVRRTVMVWSSVLTRNVNAICPAGEESYALLFSIFCLKKKKNKDNDCE